SWTTSRRSCWRSGTSPRDGKAPGKAAGCCWTTSTWWSTCSTPRSARSTAWSACGRTARCWRCPGSRTPAGRRRDAAVGQGQAVGAVAPRRDDLQRVRPHARPSRHRTDGGRMESGAVRGARTGQVRTGSGGVVRPSPRHRHGDGADRGHRSSAAHRQALARDTPRRMAGSHRRRGGRRLARRAGQGARGRHLGPTRWGESRGGRRTCPAGRRGSRARVGRGGVACRARRVDRCAHCGPARATAEPLDVAGWYRQLSLGRAEPPGRQVASARLQRGDDRVSPRLLVFGDSLSFHGPDGPRAADDERLWPNVAAAELGGAADLVARAGWTARDAWWAMIEDPRVWADLRRVDAVVLAVGSMDTLPSPLPTYLRTGLRYLRPDGLRRMVRKGYLAAQPRLAVLLRGRRTALPVRVTVRYLDSAVGAVRTLRPELPIVGILPSIHRAESYGYVHTVRDPAAEAIARWAK